MYIQIVDVSDNVITEFTSSGQPFKVGDSINVNVSNIDRDFWDVKEVKGIFKVKRIEYFLRKKYGANGRVNELLTVTLTVVLIEKEGE